MFAGLLKGFGRGDTRADLEGFRARARAEWLPEQEWESMLALPLEEVRARLKVGAPPEYTPLRTSELRAAGMI